MASPLTETDYFKAWILLLIGGVLSGGIIGAVVSTLVRSYYTYYPMSTNAPRIVGLATIVVLALAASYLLFRYLVSRFIVRRLTSANAREPASSRAS